MNKRDFFTQTIMFVIVLLLWDLASTMINRPYLYPSPLMVLRAFYRLFLEYNLLYHILITLYRVFLGFTLGVLFGLVVGLVALISHVFKNTIYPYVVFITVTPSITLVPLLMIWIGLNDLLPIIAIMICTSFPLIYSTISSIKNIDPELIDAAVILGAKKIDLVIRIIFPLSLTHIATLLKVEAGHGWRIGFITEYLALPNGLGALMYYSYATLHVDQIIALIIIIGVLALLFQITIEYMETIITRKWGLGH